MSPTPNSTRVPATMAHLYNSITSLVKPFCDQHLNEEYFDLIQQATAALCRKRPCPLTSGSQKAWACGIVHAIGSANFLFDKSTKPFVPATDICDFFDVGTSTSTNRSKQIKEWLKVNPYNYTWCLPSLMEKMAPIWMLAVDGYIIDIRTAPRELQEICLEKGLIPFIPSSPSRKYAQSE